MDTSASLEEFLRDWLARAPDFTTQQLTLVRLLDALLRAKLIRFTACDFVKSDEHRLKVQLEKAGACDGMIKTVPEVLDMFVMWRLGRKRSWCPGLRDGGHRHA